MKTKEKEMSKRYFKVTMSGYGGEFVMGRISEEFAEYWQDLNDMESLGVHLQQISWDDEVTDTNSPPMIDGENRPWFEVDDIEHMQQVLLSSYYTWVECDADGEELDDAEEGREDLEDTGIYGTELYSSDEKECDEDFPVLIFHTVEKGTFGSVIIETNGADFDPEKFKTTYIETDMGEFVNRAFYDRKDLDIDYDYSETYGKGSEARIGWVNDDSIETPDEEIIQEYLAEY